VLEWITALRAPAIRKLVDSGDLQLSLFDEQDLAESTAPELYPGASSRRCSPTSPR